MDYYRQRAFVEGVREHFTAGSMEALDALRQEFRSAAAELRGLEKAAESGSLDPKTAHQALNLSRAVAYAADKYLDALGFKRYRSRLVEMQAEQETTGKTGQTVHLEGGDKPIEHRHEYEPSEDEALEIASILHDVGALPTGESSPFEAADDAET